MRIVFLALARIDLRDIAFYIAGDNKSRAQTFVRELREKARELARNPRAFSVGQASQAIRSVDGYIAAI